MKHLINQLLSVKLMVLEYDLLLMQNPLHLQRILLELPCIFELHIIDLQEPIRLYVLYPLKFFDNLAQVFILVLHFILLLLITHVVLMDFG